jgi:Zn-dependent protease with chaperone function
LNFFDAQDKARRSTRRLVILYLLATAGIIVGVAMVVAIVLWMAGPLDRHTPFAQFVPSIFPLLAFVAVLVAVFIMGASAYKTSALSSGGGKVAESMGGTLVPPSAQDLALQRLRNVVEEMAIASGVPVPDIYVLEQEGGINAFAAGYETGDAAVAVTRGTLNLLNREELQGVIGHEFSHILNGDMRLNIRLMGILYGITVISLIGRSILRGSHWTGRRGRGQGLVAVAAIGLTILGWIGIFGARVIKARVSRQREYLADASAVQFTRQTDGIANALKKIGGYQSGSYLQATDPEEVSHMLFGTGSRLSGLFATHPPLTERIQALDPGFTPSDYPVVDRGTRDSVAGETRAAGLHSGASAAVVGSESSAADLTATITDMVGDPGKEHLQIAAMIRSSVPEALYDAAHSRDLAYLLAVALVLDRSGKVTERQLGIVSERLGAERTRLIRQFYVEITQAGAEYRLPLMEIAYPALKRRPAPELDYLIDLAGRLIEVDGEIDLYEYCYYRILVTNLNQAIEPLAKRRTYKASRKPVRKAAIEILRIVARHGHADIEDQKQAFRTGAASFGKWGDKFEFETNHDYSIQVLDKSLEVLLALNGEGKKSLLNALTATAMWDRELRLEEAELIRAICASLACPLPPILLEVRPTPLEQSS